MTISRPTVKIDTSASVRTAGSILVYGGLQTLAVESLLRAWQTESSGTCRPARWLARSFLCGHVHTGRVADLFCKVKNNRFGSEGMEDIEVIRTAEREVAEADATSGMVREQAFAEDGVWTGLVRTAAGRPSDWHHHGDYDTYFYVQSAKVRMEFGPGGVNVVEAEPGDFVHVPKGVVHRETNPTDEEGAVVLVRIGSGPPVINVEGPPPSV